jgi:calcineurin-like phosphoesterase family protein
MSKTYFTSDWHLFHFNILKYDDRPFRNLDEMHQKLIKNYNSVVKDDDTVYFLGDMGFAKKESIKEIIDQLKGTKILCLGNHDGNAQKMKDCGFNFVVYGVTLYIQGQKVTLGHYPLLDLERYTNTNKFGTFDTGQFHLHGHCHFPPEKKIRGKQWDMGVRANNYMPVSISQVESWIEKFPKKGT